MNTQNRFHLSITGQYVDHARTASGAFVKAMYLAKRQGVKVHVFDNEGQGVDLWEFRPYELFARPVRVKH